MPDKGLAKAFEGKALEVYQTSGIGEKGLDCIMDAIHSGYHITVTVKNRLPGTSGPLISNVL